MQVKRITNKQESIVTHVNVVFGSAQVDTKVPTREPICVCWTTVKFIGPTSTGGWFTCSTVIDKVPVNDNGGTCVTSVRLRPKLYDRGPCDTNRRRVKGCTHWHIETLRK